MVPRGDEADEYGSILEAIVALSYVAARHDRLLLGTSVIVPAMRDAPLLAKQLATLDLLSGGRLMVRVGASDRADLAEYANLGKQGRFADRGAYLDETIALWRHLWSGDTRRFPAALHPRRLHVPAAAGAAAAIPILCGGRSPRALARVVRLADGYHAAQTGPQIGRELPGIAAECEPTRRPLPQVSVRARVRFGAEPGPRYSLCGSAGGMAAELEAFAAAGAGAVAVVLDAVRPEDISPRRRASTRTSCARPQSE